MWETDWPILYYWLLFSLKKQMTTVVASIVTLLSKYLLCPNLYSAETLKWPDQWSDYIYSWLTYWRRSVPVMEWCILLKYSDLCIIFNVSGWSSSKYLMTKWNILFVRRLTVYDSQISHSIGCWLACSIYMCGCVNERLLLEKENMWESNG